MAESTFDATCPMCQHVNKWPMTTDAARISMQGSGYCSNCGTFMELVINDVRAAEYPRKNGPTNGPTNEEKPT